MPDPAGRIAFGGLLRIDDVLGQLVSLYAIDPDGSDLVQLLDCEVQFPRLSPDGTRVAFGIAMDDGHDQVATMAVDGGDLRILATPGFGEQPDWSPDGSWLIYPHTAQECPAGVGCIQTLGLREALWRMDADGSDQRQVGASDVNDVEPRLSLDGRQVVFIRLDRARDLRQTLMIRDLATGAERQVTADDREPEHPAWSPDGKWIIYNTVHAAVSDAHFQQVERTPVDAPTAVPEVLYAGDVAVRPNGSTRTGYKASYSPDGRSIVFGCGVPGRVCTMDADRSNVNVVLEVPGLELNHFAWGVAPNTGG